MLQTAWRLPLRKLVLAMPITAVIVAVAAHALTDLGWTRVLPARRAALPDRPGAVVERRHQPARAAPRAPLAQPRVGPERRPRAAGRARVLGRAAASARTTSSGGSSCSRTSRWASASGLARRLRRQPAAAARQRDRRLDPGPPEVALRARDGVRDLRHRRRAAAGGQRADRGVRVRDRARHPAARPARDVRAPVRGHRRDRQARRVRRVRLAADASTGCSATAGPPSRSSPSRCSSPGRWRSGSR